MTIAVNASKKFLLLLFACFLFAFSHAQNVNWILGTWKGTGSDDNNVQFIKTIVIDSVYGTNFSGTRTNESKDHNHVKIIASFSGYIDNDLLYIKNGSVIYKKVPANGVWLDCSACLPETKVTIDESKIILTSRITGCQKECNSVSVYYKLLCDYDTSTQRYLVNRFGTASDIKNFTPCKPPEMIAEEQKRQQQIQDSITTANNIAKQKEQQRIQDSIATATALAKERQKEIDDSVVVAKKRQQQIDDSLKVVAAAEKKRQQYIQDSIATANNIAKQNEQQRIQDSITTATALAKKRQKEIDDSVVVAKKRQQQIQDSLTTANNIAKQKEQQRIQDSIATATGLAKKRQKEIDDSIVVAKKRQQQIQDSLTTANNIAKQKEQQRIQDSIATATALAKKRQKEIDDSIVVAKKRQQHIQDSITTANNIAKQKEQQRVQDSIATATALAKKRQKEIDDSIAVAKKRQLQIDDSLKVVAAAEKKRQQHIQDSITVANNIAKQKEQKRIQDSITNAATIAKTPITVISDTAKTSTTKAFETRDNVLLQTYHISTPDILIELFDNAQIDGDRVSVYHNNELIVNNKTLLREPITIKIHADPANRVHEFVMIAENLGSIPPNTALMRITVGTQVYKLSVKTDLKTNAKIVFSYDGN